MDTLNSSTNLKPTAIDAFIKAIINNTSACDMRCSSSLSSIPYVLKKIREMLLNNKFIINDIHVFDDELNSISAIGITKLIRIITNTMLNDSDVGAKSFGVFFSYFSERDIIYLFSKQDSAVRGTKVFSIGNNVDRLSPELFDVSNYARPIVIGTNNNDLVDMSYFSKLILASESTPVHLIKKMMTRNNYVMVVGVDNGLTPDIFDAIGGIDDRNLSWIKISLKENPLSSCYVFVKRNQSFDRRINQNYGCRVNVRDDNAACEKILNNKALAKFVHPEEKGHVKRLISYRRKLIKSFIKPSSPKIGLSETKILDLDITWTDSANWSKTIYNKYSTDENMYRNNIYKITSLNIRKHSEKGRRADDPFNSYYSSISISNKLLEIASDRIADTMAGEIIRKSLVKSPEKENLFKTYCTMLKTAKKKNKITLLKAGNHKKAIEIAKSKIGIMVSVKHDYIHIKPIVENTLYFDKHIYSIENLSETSLIDNILDAFKIGVSKDEIYHKSTITFDKADRELRSDRVRRHVFSYKLLDNALSILYGTGNYLFLNLMNTAAGIKVYGSSWPKGTKEKSLEGKDSRGKYYYVLMNNNMKIKARYDTANGMIIDFPLSVATGIVTHLLITLSMKYDIKIPDYNLFNGLVEYQKHRAYDNKGLVGAVTTSEVEVDFGKIYLMMLSNSIRWMERK